MSSILFLSPKLTTNRLILKEFHNIEHHYCGSGNFEKGTEKKAYKSAHGSFERVCHPATVDQQLR